MGAPRFFRGRRFLVETSKVEQVTVVSEDGRPQNIADRIKTFMERCYRWWPSGWVRTASMVMPSFIATTNNLRPLTDPTGSRRFVCVYADEIDNSGLINYDMLYAQLYTELQQGCQYWFEDEDNARIMQQNEPFQQVNSYEQMIALTYLAPEETPDDAKFVSLQTMMVRLEKLFPTFTITKGTDIELGRRLVKMGYQHKRSNKGSVFRVEEI